MTIASANLWGALGMPGLTQGRTSMGEPGLLGEVREAMLGGWEARPGSRSDAGRAACNGDWDGAVRPILAIADSW